jgi:two-component system response regulator YesN
MIVSHIDKMTKSIQNKEFWDSLHREILKSNLDFESEDLYSYVEKSFMFSMFFRNTSHKELCVFRDILKLQDLGFLILLEFQLEDNANNFDFEIDELALYYFIKDKLKLYSTAVGPMVDSRLSILITDGPDNFTPSRDTKYKNISTADKLINALQEEYGYKVTAGVSNIHSIHSIYTSFLEALSCMIHCTPGKAIHILDLDEHIPNHQFEYVEAEKLLIEAVRLRKPDAYNYFGLMMHQIKNYNDTVKRSKIIEALIMSAHAARVDTTNDVYYIDYTSYIDSLMKLKGNELIEWAFQKFVDITGNVKQTNAIDYSSRIVQATKEYLEANYAEEISLEDVAEFANISPQYFSKLIKKSTGFNFTDWLSMLRVKKAKELLTNPNLTVKEVCFMVGYKDPNYFSRIFKKRIGLTPSEYMKMNQ